MCIHPTFNINTFHVLVKFFVKYSLLSAMLLLLFELSSKLVDRNNGTIVVYFKNLLYLQCFRLEKYSMTWNNWHCYCLAFSKTLSFQCKERNKRSHVFWKMTLPRKLNCFSTAFTAWRYKHQKNVVAKWILCFAKTC